MRTQVLLDTSTLYNKAGVQVMRLRLIDLEYVP